MFFQYSPLGSIRNKVRKLLSIRAPPLLQQTPPLKISLKNPSHQYKSFQYSPNQILLFPMLLFCSSSAPVIILTTQPNKNIMQVDSEQVASRALSHILDNVYEGLHVNKLATFIPDYNQNYISRVGHTALYAFDLPQPPIKGPFPVPELPEDNSPPQIHLDSLAVNLLKSVSDTKEMNIYKEPQSGSQQTYRRTSSRYRKTGESYRSSFSKRDSSFFERQKIQLDKYFIVPPNKHTQPIQLRIKEPSQEEIDMELELRALQKKLYYSRQLKKQEQQKQLQRIEALKNRKSPPLPKHDFTYAFDGNLMRRKVWKKDSVMAEEMKVSQSFDGLPQSEKKSLQELDDELQSERGRSKLQSRYKRASVFNNFHKRQISHLPFIKMTENSKIRQENKYSQGSRTHRVTLKGFEETNEDRGGFKHHSEIEKQKKQKQLLQKLRLSKENQQDEEGETQQNLQDNPDNSMVRKRQSYMMNRYLKKLREQNPEAARRSLNFSRANFPKNTAIHNYYKHDFNTERKLYESEMVSRVLDAPSDS